MPLSPPLPGETRLPFSVKTHMFLRKKTVVKDSHGRIDPRFHSDPERPRKPHPESLFQVTVRP